MRLLWTPLARDDLISIRQYIAEHNPTAAKGIAARLLHAANMLRDRPYLGLRTHRDDIRRLVVGNSVYSIIYRVRDDDIEIIEIFDGRQNAPRTDIGDDQPFCR